MKTEGDARMCSSDLYPRGCSEVGRGPWDTCPMTVSRDCWPSDLVAGQRTVAMQVVDVP